MLLKLRQKQSKRPLDLAAEWSQQTRKSLKIQHLYKIDIHAEGICRLAADVHLLSAEK